MRLITVYKPCICNYVALLLKKKPGYVFKFWLIMSMSVIFSQWQWLGINSYPELQFVLLYLPKNTFYETYYKGLTYAITLASCSLSKFSGLYTQL